MSNNQYNMCVRDVGNTVKARKRYKMQVEFLKKAQNKDENEIEMNKVL
jgi:hypothetical protein